MAVNTVSGVNHYTGQPGDLMPTSGAGIGSTFTAFPADVSQPVRRFIYDGKEWRSTVGENTVLLAAIEMLASEVRRLRLGMMLAGTCKEVK